MERTAQLIIGMTLLCAALPVTPMKYAAWVHGSALQHRHLEGAINDWKLLHSQTGSGVEIRRGSSSSTVATFALPIPAPVIIDDRRLKFVKVMVRYRAENGAYIDRVIVNDRENQLNYVFFSSPASSKQIQMITVHAAAGVNTDALWGYGVAIRVNSGDRCDAILEIISAGIDFD
ncbi:uncharacterized protein LOC129588948 isoform X1 [Paramacrobiotus metropolitanus]|uniref:uncharacterized protein LOC129588948 isoform X1 n=2 Tax=Paramacrobiotus metropolitanus TaxID=2943436 RepID=UPI002446424F|nr:uncharacterized protein LOC129588948 isoform X1 [Paramacrobiotus metropolitanus]